MHYIGHLADVKNQLTTAIMQGQKVKSIRVFRPIVKLQTVAVELPTAQRTGTATQRKTHAQDLAVGLIKKHFNHLIAKK